ncbi:DUF6531 domain-containing protein [Niabella yanshanensis]|uniref:DUF6531 domain-containing protein n=1 Tax=Niabella yanshanensis TaxID=577386 RepID=A0ABZ0WBM5_9BACT|nr:DUF6531 domain-containing protein [Niabella yanshanensis]WQD40054.1 DUF6531 domain-containing protein [Niabella yanshanensis]
MAVAAGSAPSKGFGELFGEAKGKLDELQAGLASIFPAMPGMPAGKYFDLAMGIDFEQTIAPPCPVFPVPHVGLVFDIFGAVMNAIASALPPPPAEGEGFSVAGVAATIVNALKPSVKVHSRWINNAGTPVMHLPAMFLHLLPMAVPTSSSEMWMGSSTVLADGGPFSTQFHPALSCNLVGFPSLPRMNKTPRPVLDLMMPTSMLLAIISSGGPVLVGGPPTIDLFQLMLSLGIKGLSKAWKKLGDKFQDIIDKIAKKNEKLANVLQSIKCKSFGEPVDAATGRVIHTNVDFDLPGPIPLVWERTYYSDAEVETSLGYNWHHSYNIGLYDVGNGFAIRLKDGREAALPYLQKGEIFYHRIEQLFFEKDEAGYFVTDEHKLVYRFSEKKDRQGFAMIASITNPQGFDIRFDYDAKGSLSAIIDSSGRMLRVQCDELGRVLRVYTIANNRRINFIQYTYDAAGNMVTNEDVLGAVKRFEYDGHLLVKLTNQSDHSFYWEYEGKGDDARCIHTWGDGGILEYWTEYKQNEDGSGITITRDSLGHETEYFYDNKKLIYKIVDANGGITRQIYNQYQDLEVLVNPEGGKVQYQYNGYGKVVRVINENDEASTYLYDDRLNLVFAGSPGGKTMSWEYDQQNRLVNRSGVAGNPVYYTYDNKDLRYITDNKERRFELIYDEQHNLSRLRYPNGLEQLWSYDELGNTIFHKDIRGNITTYENNDAGLVTRIKGPDGNIHQFEYDAARNMIEVRDYSHLVQFDYGPLGVLRGRKQNDRVVRFNYDTELQLRSIVNEGGEVYRFGLDALGNVVSEWGFDGLNRRYQRDGNSRVSKVLRPDEKWTSYDYDSLGNIVKEEHSDGSMAAYKYDADAMLSEAINETSHIKLIRDKSGRVIREEQDGYWVGKTYDSDGNCIRTASSQGADIAMQYDEWGMLIEMSGKCGPGIEAQPSPAAASLDAKLKEVDARVARLTGAVNPESQPKASEPAGWQAVFQRDDSGLELHRQLSGGVSVQTERDRLGRVTRRAIGAKHIEQSKTRYDWGLGNKLHKIVNEITRTQANFEYDAFDNLVSATYEDKSGTETIYRVPDKIGNLFKTKDKSDRKYSKGGRLLEDDQYCYYYDAEGNLIFKEFKRNENLSAIDKTEIAKEKGIALRRTATGWEYEWAGNGMLQKVINPGGREIEFYYDPLGRRTAKIVKTNNSSGLAEEPCLIVNDTITRFVWDGNVPLHEWQYKGQYPSKKTITEEGIKEEKEPVENIITWLFEEGAFVPCAKFEGEKKYSIVADYLGTPTHAYDGDGKIVWERELDIYGTTRQQKGENGFVPYLYQGQYVDEETGLAYNRFRYYDNGSGNYISQDPIGFHGGLRMYKYVANVAAHFDSLGLSSTILNKNLGGVVGDQMQAHHVIPEQVWKANQDFFDDIGLQGQMDKATNGILLPDKASMIDSEGPQIVHRGSHPRYNDEIADRVTNIRGAYDAGLIDASTAKKQVWKLQNEYKNKLWEGDAQHKIVDGKKKLH